MGRFRIATFSDTGDTLRNLGGAALMGIGGVMALGCTVGQAITGVSTLALGSFLTFAAIVAGGFYGLRVLERDRVNRRKPMSQLDVTRQRTRRRSDPEAARARQSREPADGRGDRGGAGGGAPRRRRSAPAS